MKKTLLALAAIVGVATGADAQILIAGWDFQTTTSGGTAVAASPATPKVYVANVGSGTLYADGSNGSSSWFVPASGSTNTELNGFTGTDVNAGGATGLTTVTTSPAALALVGGLSQAANGKGIVFRLDMTGYQDLVISYATQATSTGFDLQTWSYSTDGSSWVSFDSFDPKLGGSVSTTFATVGVVTLDTITGLNNVSTAYVQLVVTGASNSSGNNRLDNIQFNASEIVPVPEPHEYAIAMGGLLLTVIVMRRRRSIRG